MAHTVTHAKVSTVSDSGNASLVQPSDWNAAHTVTVDASLVDHGSLAGLSDDDHTSYHTDARALTWLGTRSTTDLPEGTNLYYTDVRADARVAVHTGDTTDAHAASAITNTPAGGIAATTVQAALNELDGDKAAASHTHSLADITDEGALASLNTVGTSQIDNDAVTYAKIQNVSATDRLLGRDTALAGDVEELTVGGGIEFTGTGGIQTSAFTGDVTKSAGGTATTIANDAVTNAKLANMAANTIKGRVTGSTGDPEDLSAANARTILGLAFGTTDNALLRADGAGNSATQGSAATLNDAGDLTLTSSTAQGGLTINVTDGGAVGAGIATTHATASPAANDALFLFNVAGKDDAANTQTFAQFICYLLDPTNGSEDCMWYFLTTVAGAAAERMRIGGGVYHSSATGGDKGNNTTNFGAQYDDNTLLTCAPVEMLQTGAVDVAKWDALVPPIDVKERKNKEGKVVTEARFERRQHKVVREFKAMVDSGFDPRNPRNFVDRMKADGAVPGLMTQAEWNARIAANDKPDMGYMMTRIMLALDNLAVMNASLLDRIEALEKKQK